MTTPPNPDTGRGGPFSVESTESRRRPVEAPVEPRTTRAPHNTPTPATDPTEPREGTPMDHTEPADRWKPRTWTPDSLNGDGSTTITMKRACNGCGRQLGDVTDQEMACGMNGLPLPDVRRECPACAPTAPEPKCLPAQVVTGDADCLDGDCAHDIALDAEYCVKVTEVAVCVTHSEISSDGVITRAAAWPCTHAKAVTR